MFRKLGVCTVECVVHITRTCIFCFQREHFLGLLEEQGSPDYFWTGGMLEFAGRNRFQRELKIVWPNRKEEPVRRG